MTSDDAFMMLAGVRYCLGRHSYAPSLCCGWLKTKWQQVDQRDRAQIVREIGEHIAYVEGGRCHNTAPGWEDDLRTWQAFLTWAGGTSRAAQPSDQATGTAWPSGCIKPNACSRHRQCMYARSVEQCRHFDQDLTQAVEAAVRDREWAAAQPKERAQP
jgi:hypothetical protein